MSKGKRPSLADFGRTTPAAEPQEPTQEAAPRPARPRARGGKGERKTKPLSDGRVQLLTWQQPAAILELKRLGLDLERSASDLVAEGIDHVLQMNGRPPLARPRQDGES